MAHLINSKFSEFMWEYNKGKQIELVFIILITVKQFTIA
jgi:hypothetical protein